MHKVERTMPMKKNPNYMTYDERVFIALYRRLSPEEKQALFDRLQQEIDEEKARHDLVHNLGIVGTSDIIGSL